MIKNSLRLLAIFCLSAEAIGEVILKSGHVVITSEDVKYFVEQGIPEDKRQEALAKEGVYRQIAEGLYLTKKMAELASKNKDVDSERIRWVGEYQTNNHLKESLLDRVADLALKEVNFDVTAKDIYEKEKSLFMTEEKTRVSHILISTQKKGKDEALNLAKNLKARIDNGENFTELAVQYSDDPSVKLNAGDVGFFGEGQMVPEFEAAAKKMDKPGQISDIVKTQFGYHIIKFTARLAPIQKPFEEVKPLIIPELKQRLAAKFRQDFIQSVLGGSKLEFDEKALKSLQSSFGSK